MSRLQMKNYKSLFIILVLILSFFFALPLNAQYGTNYRQPKPYHMMFGVAVNAVEDNGDRFTNVFDIDSSMNFMWYPLAFNFNYYFKRGVSLDILASYNRYDTTKIINGERGISSNFFALDANVMYGFRTRVPNVVADPFIFGGLHLTYREVNPEILTGLNFGAGININMFAGFGFQLRTSFKTGLLPQFFNVQGDYWHNHLGLFYKLPEPRARNTFGNRKHSWVDKRNYKYKPRKVR